MVCMVYMVCMVCRLWYVWYVWYDSSNPVVKIGGMILQYRNLDLYVIQY